MAEPVDKNASHHSRLLISLGLIELPNRRQRYAYKGITGRLEPEINRFHFHGLSVPLFSVIDLRYIMMLIDYQESATFVGYPSNLN